MRKKSILGIVSMCLITLLCGISHAGVVGTKHDLSTAAGTGGSQFTFYTRQVCVFCHTPHTANTAVRQKTSINSGGGVGYLNTSGASAGNPVYLWNRALTNQTTASFISFDVYASSTLDATVDEIRAYSLMCLSCHDGVGAMNVMANPPDKGGPTGPPEQYDANGNPDVEGWGDQLGDLCDGTGTGFCVQDPNIGERTTGGLMPPDSGVVNLTNDHPISFDYDEARNNEIAAGGTTGLVAPSGDGHVGTDNLRLFPNPSGSWVSLECSTCHDPHNWGTTTDVTRPFLVVSNRESRLCRNCHLK